MTDDRVTELEASVGRLVEALRPFAAIGEWLGPRTFPPSSRSVRVYAGAEKELPDKLPDEDDFRRARQAIADQQGHGQ